MGLIPVNAEWASPLPNETSKAWEAFCVYRDLGKQRTHEQTRLRLGKKAGYTRVIENWSYTYNWVKRSLAYDTFVHRQEIEADIEERIEFARQSRQQARDLSSKLMEKAQTMLQYPLTKQKTTKDQDGTVVQVTFEPVKWGARDISPIAQAAVELSKFGMGTEERMSELEALETLVDSGWLPPGILTQASVSMDEMKEKIRDSFINKDEIIDVTQEDPEGSTSDTGPSEEPE